MKEDPEATLKDETDLSSTSFYLKAGSYLLANVMSATCIIFANKVVLSVLRFKFVYSLTFLHVVTTFLGLQFFAALGLFERKSLPFRPLLSLSAAFVGYIVFWNLSLQVNTVGFYQLSKICITPTALLVESVGNRKWPTKQEMGSIAMLCAGVAQATLSEKQMSTNLIGLGTAAIAVVLTVAYQRLAGSKQKELEVSAMALMNGYTPIASSLLACLIPVLEPLGIQNPTEDTLLGFPYTLQVVSALAITALLGLAVSLSTFLSLGSVSSVAFNVVGHSKTIIVLAGGCLLFGEAMPLKRLAGICLALTGMAWFSFIRLKVFY